MAHIIFLLNTDIIMSLISTVDIIKKIKNTKLNL